MFLKMKVLLRIWLFLCIVAAFLLGVPVAVFCFFNLLYTDNPNLFNNWVNWWWDLIQRTQEKINSHAKNNSF